VAARAAIVAISLVKVVALAAVAVVLIIHKVVVVQEQVGKVMLVERGVAQGLPIPIWLVVEVAALEQQVKQVKVMVAVMVVLVVHRQFLDHL
jgi:hypothetical protein